MDGLYWLIFLGTLAAIVYGWGITILRLIQDWDRLTAKLCLITHVFIPLGFALAFIYGWSNYTRLQLRVPMLTWTIGLVVLTAMALFTEMPAI